MMNTLGIQLQLLIGPTIPLPAPAPVIQAIDQIEVTHQDEGRSGFQITWNIDTSDAVGLATAALLNSPLFRVFNRVVITVIFKGMPQVLMDGIITNQQMQPGEQPGGVVFTVTGEDVSLMMDLEDRNAEHPAQDETVIALKLIAMYAQYGLIPLVIPPVVINPPLPTEWIPVQQATDLDYLKQIAQRHAYVFYVTPGPAPLTSTAYWGPPVRAGVPQRALSVNMGAHSNVDSINFEHNALAPADVSGSVQDRQTNTTLPVQSTAPLRPPLASQPNWLVYRGKNRQRQFRDSGVNVVQANARAQAEMERSNDAVVTAQGRLDALRYGAVLQPRALVGLRGAGLLYDGFYYVRRVTHTLQKGSYQQSFQLAREGLGTTTPVVIP